VQLVLNTRAGKSMFLKFYVLLLGFKKRKIGKRAKNLGLYFFLRKLSCLFSS